VNVHAEQIGDLVILELEGRIVRSDSAFELRDAVVSHADVSTVVLDFTEVHALDGGGLGMLIYLQHWARERRIQLKLFNPTLSVQRSLERANSMSPFEVASLPEMMAILALAEEHSRSVRAA
jgi:anti-anti-sigma regulatory factor